jgi:hypothetical protein
MFKLIRVGIGISKAISISKTKNKTARMKNRKEKGIRAELCGSNPHSNGVDFSKLILLLLFNTSVAIMINRGNNVAHIIAIVIIVIPLGNGKILLMK